MNSESKIKRKKWKEKIEAWQASGKSAASWCRENNVPTSTFCGWKQQLNLVSK